MNGDGIPAAPAGSWAVNRERPEAAGSSAGCELAAGGGNGDVRGREACSALWVPTTHVSFHVSARPGYRFPYRPAM
jgi:hypothetical protein